ncbi:MAG TPA: MopE-related protein [Kofleriaceae bacterium]|nr:MopE-related protein [Kofleriaceae bacterium]
MDDVTGSGPTSCGKVDNKINHAVCAINNIVNSYGDMVFSLARFRETTSGTYTNSCGPGGQCTTRGPQCGDCNYILGIGAPCTANSGCDSANGTTGNGGSCILTGADGNCTDNIDNDGDGYVNEGCATVSGTDENRNFTVNGITYNGCLDNIDNDGDLRVNDGCPAFGRCTEGSGGTTVLTTRGCTTADDGIEILTPLVDGNNSSAALVTNGTCNTCSITGTTDPEIWGVGGTSTPLAAALKGAKRYWQGFQASNGTTTIWQQTLAGFDPINRDPQNAVFLQAPSTVPTTCNSDRATCNPSVACTGANCCCDTCNPNPTTCNSSGTCVGANCCCATQCRPYVTILLTDGDETCANFTNSTVPAAASLLSTAPRVDGVNVNTFARSANVATVTTTGAHPFAVGNVIVVSGSTDASFNGTFTITSVTSATTFTFASTGSNTGATSGTPATVRHAASDFAYRIETKPIGFGKAPGDAEIEAIAHAGGAADLPGVNEGYYAANEQDLSLAISQILADSVRSESCNGRDDDCDVRVDEDFPNKNQSCQATWPANDPISPGGVAVGLCARNGTSICRPDGTGTQCNTVPNPRGTEGPGCNGLDEDCDGRVDEGLSCQQCVPTGEVCDGNDNDCDTVADQTCRCSNNNSVKCDGTNTACGTGTCVCTGISQGCSVTNSFGTCPGTRVCTGGSLGTCTGQVPAAEICNGADEDCDGVCDGFTLGCSEVVSNCVPSVGNSCPPADNPGEASHGPILHSESGLRCQNNTDDDGDGVVNDGCPTFPVAGGVAESACSGAADDDTDGRINDGCPAVATALIPQNVCHAGSKTCAVPASCPAGSNAFGICSGEVKPAASDACNALDDDCDNAIDEDFTPADCSTNCGVGQTQCVGGVITCNSTPATNDNTCNNVDDDCDGKFDENWVCNPAANCTGPDCCVCGTGTTCEKNKCVNGVRTCVVDPPINTEVCDCNDNNCNGQIDEGQLCPSGSTCTGCQCAFGCDPNTEFACPSGKRCIQPSNTTACTIDGDCPTDEFCNQTNHYCASDNFFCVNDPCYGVSCPAVNGNPQKCIPNPDPTHANEHQCVNLCDGVTCSSTEICLDSDGICHPNNCLTFPNMCNAQQACVNGTCVTNPCQGVTCASNQYCLGGTCVQSCADLECADGQRCRQGMCETDPCGKPCPFGQACNDNTGKCINDPCSVQNCGTNSGQWCNPNSGQCEDDPCAINDIKCPNADEVCRGGTCLDPDSLRPDAAGEAHVTVGGGGGCDTTGGGSTGVLLALALMVARRRRARVSSAARGEGGAQ